MPLTVPEAWQAHSPSVSIGGGGAGAGLGRGLGRGSGVKVGRTYGAGAGRGRGAEAGPRVCPGRRCAAGEVARGVGGGTTTPEEGASSLTVPSLEMYVVYNVTSSCLWIEIVIESFEIPKFARL